MIKIFNLFFPIAAFAQGKEWTGKCVGPSNFTGSQGLSGNAVFNSTLNASDVATIGGLECLFYNILQIVVGVAGLAFFIMFIIGGFKYLTSSGDSKKVAAASSTLTMAIIGVVGVIASWLILLFIRKFTGVDVTNFTIPSGS